LYFCFNLFNTMADQNLKINITGDSSKLSSALSSASSKLSAFGSKMQSVGKSMTTKLTLPLVAAGAAATKMAFDFDKSMTSIQALVGVSSKKVAEMGEAAKKMAVDTGKSSKEAAEALFFITSAGLRGSEAMDVLEMSLKAAAVGLGETKTIADLSTSAMNAYGSGTLSASGATDILTAAVREGKLEASALAGAMGGVIPLASNMGVSFDQVGAAMAAMSKTGTDAATGATQLTAILASLKKPSAEAEKAFSAMGMTTESVQKSLSEQGLLSTLEMLQNGLKQTGQDTTAIFPNIRALKGVLDLTGAGLEDNRKVFDALTKSMGATDTAFEKTSKAASFKMTQGLNSMKESLMGVGQVILVAIAPAVQKLGEFFTNLSNKFKELSPRTQKIIIAFAGIVAALGPVIAIIGTLLTMAPAIGAAFTLMMGPVGLIIAGLTAISVVIYKNWAGIKQALVDIGNYFIDLYNNSLPIKLAVNALIMNFKNMLAVGKFVFSTFLTIIKTFASNFITIFKGIGDILIGVFTFNKDKIVQGFSDLTSGLKNNFTNAFDAIKTDASILGGSVVDNFNEALKSKTIAKIVIPVEMAVSGGASTSEGVTGGGATTSVGGDGGGGGVPTRPMATSAMEGISGAEIQTPISDMIAADTARMPQAFAEQQAVLAQNRLMALEQAAQFSQRISQIMTGGLQNLASGIGSALGNAISSGGNLAGSLSKVILGSIGGMAVQLGKLAIGIGVTLAKIKAAFASLAPGVAIAAGIALVALGSVFKNKAASIGSGGGGGSSFRGGGFASGGISGGGGGTAFANGGIVSGPTMGLVGEYPGARQNPEVIAPLNKLQSIIGKSNNGGNLNVTGQVRIDGQDLLIAIERANETAGRIY
jgi:TP901 family phage tail tape measure protein